MKIVKSEDKIKDNEEFLRLTGKKGNIFLSYCVFEGTVVGRGSDMGGPHRDVTTFAEEEFKAEHSLTSDIYSTDETGNFSFSEIRNMEFILFVSRERTYTHNTLDKIHPYNEDFPLIESLKRKEALKKINGLARERIKEYINNTPIEKIYIGADSKRSEAFLESLVA